MFKVNNKNIVNFEHISLLFLAFLLLTLDKYMLEGQIPVFPRERFGYT